MNNDKLKINTAVLNRVFIFGEYFVPKNLTFIEKFVIWFKFKRREREVKREAYRASLQLNKIIYETDDTKLKELGII